MTRPGPGSTITMTCEHCGATNTTQATEEGGFTLVTPVCDPACPNGGVPEHYLQIAEPTP